LNVPLMMFVDILQGFKDKFISDEDDEADMSKLSYAAEAVRKEDVHDLSQKLMTAPVIDSVFERYPQDVDRQDDQKTGPLQSAIWLPVGSKKFRDDCEAVPFKNEKIYNVSGSSKDKRAKSWVLFWSYMMLLCFRNPCVIRCKIKITPPTINNDRHTELGYILRGGHMTKNDKFYYILPICPFHNKTVVFDWPNGESLTTIATAWAIKIRPKP